MPHPVTAKVLAALRGTPTENAPGYWAADGVFVHTDGHPPPGRVWMASLPLNISVYAGVRHPSRRPRFLPTFDVGRWSDGRVGVLAEVYFGRAYVGLWRP